MAEGYERWADFYYDAPNPLLAREERYLGPLLSDLHGNTSLDLACGTGRWLEKLVANGGAVGIGIDSSLAMLRVAARKKAIRGHLARAACESLPLPSESFDFVICSFALGHVADLGCMAKELSRVTKMNADVFVSDLHPDAYARGWRVGFRDGATALQIQVQPRSTEQILQAFSANGFECLEYLPLFLGEPEQPLFAQTGKAASFADACRLPAVLICHFRRIARVTTNREVEPTETAPSYSPTAVEGRLS